MIVTLFVTILAILLQVFSSSRGVPVQDTDLTILDYNESKSDLPETIEKSSWFDLSYWYGSDSESQDSTVNTTITQTNVDQVQDSEADDSSWFNLGSYIYGSNDSWTNSTSMAPPTIISTQNDSASNESSWFDWSYWSDSDSSTKDTLVTSDLTSELTSNSPSITPSTTSNPTTVTTVQENVKPLATEKSSWSNWFWGSSENAESTVLQNNGSFDHNTISPTKVPLLAPADAVNKGKKRIVHPSQK